MTRAPQVVLLVDDNEDFHDLFAIAADEAGWRATLLHALDGAQALDQLRAPSATSPSLILLDLAMPGLNGHGVLAALRADPRLAGIPVAVLTSSDHPQDLRKATDLGALACLRKPYGLTELIDLARAVERQWLGTGG